MTLIDELVPTAHWRTRHRRRVEVPPEIAFVIAQDVTVAEIPILTARRALRGVGRRPDDNPILVGDEPTLLDDFRSQGYRELGRVPGRELVMGVAGQLWQRSAPADSSIDDAASFETYAEDRGVKSAIALRSEGEAAGALVTIETRVVATDRTAYRRYKSRWRRGLVAHRMTRVQFLAALERRARG